MSERVDEKRDDPTHQERLAAQNEAQEGDEHDVAEAERENDQVDDGQTRQVDERRVLAHVTPREDEKTQRVAEKAHDEEHDHNRFGKTWVEVGGVATTSLTVKFIF